MYQGSVLCNAWRIILCSSHAHPGSSILSKFVLSQRQSTMRNLWLSTIFIWVLAVANVKLLPADFKTGRPVQRFINLTDPDARLGAYQRTYMITIPDAYDGVSTFPLLFYFHGQYGSFTKDSVGFAELGLRKDYITVAPKGMDDGHPGDTSWSVKAEGRTDVCTKECTPTIFTSCKVVNRISPCNWATCYDDVFFVQQLLASLKSELQIDDQRIYATGPSNGGMLSDYLVTQMPGVFAAIAPWYGAFLRNMLLKPQFKGVSVLSLHGLKDTTIPADGGESYDHYLYYSENTTVLEWAVANGCSTELVKATTPFDSKLMVHTCVQHPNCSSGVTVMYCYFPDQGHAFWPTYAEDLTWWFFSVYI